MTAQPVGRPPQTLEEVENAITVAGLALAFPSGPKAIREAYDRIAQLKQLRAEMKARQAA